MKTLLLIVSALFILGCSQEKKEQQGSEQKVQEQSVKRVETKAVAAEPQKQVEQVAQKEVEPAAQKPVAKVTKTEEKVEKKPVVEVEKVKTEVVPKEVATIDKAEVDGSKLFVKCAGCHGKNAEKKALGKSQIIKGWDEAKIVTALHGYKDGTYGGSMKTVMKSQVSNLSDDEINAVAKYISKL